MSNYGNKNYQKQEALAELSAELLLKINLKQPDAAMFDDSADKISKDFWYERGVWNVC